MLSATVVIAPDDFFALDIMAVILFCGSASFLGLKKRWSTDWLI
jgi:hypothetical protein